MEKIIERTLFASRCLLAPVYPGLSLALIALAIKFFQELFHTFTIIISISDSRSGSIYPFHGQHDIDWQFNCYADIQHL